MTQLARQQGPSRHPRPSRPTPLLRVVYGRLIRRLRQRQGRTLAEVAAEAGVSIAYLSEIERGLKEPSSEVLEAVCIALGSSVMGLVGAAHVELRDGALDRPADTAYTVLDLTVERSVSSLAPVHASEPSLLAA